MKIIFQRNGAFWLLVFRLSVLSVVSAIFVCGCRSSSKGEGTTPSKTDNTPPPPPTDTGPSDETQPILMSIGDVTIRGKRQEIPVFTLTVPRFTSVPPAGIKRLQRLYKTRKGSARSSVGIALSTKLLHMSRKAAVSSDEAKKQVAEMRAQAEKILKELTTSDSPPPEALALYAEYLEEERRYEEGIKLWHRYLNSEPTPKKAFKEYVLLKLAADSLSRGDLKKAANYLKQLKDLSGEHKVLHLAYRAWVEFYKKNFDEAFDLTTESYKTAAQLTKVKKPARKRGKQKINNRTMLINRQLILKQMVLFYTYAKRASGARQEFTKLLIGIDAEQLPAVLWSLLDLYFSMGRYGEVLKLADLQNEAGVDPFSIKMALVESHLALGEENKAIDILQEAAEKSKKSDAVEDQDTDKEEKEEAVGKSDGRDAKAKDAKAKDAKAKDVKAKDVKDKVNKSMTLSRKQMDILKATLEDISANLHSRFTNSFLIADGLAADRAYEIYLKLPGLSEAEKERALKFRGELQRFRAEVEKAMKSKKESVADGMLSGQTVEKVIERYVPQLVHCLGLHLLNDRTVPERLLIQITFAPTGAVTEATIKTINGKPSTSPNDYPTEIRNLCTCITRKSLSWRFPTYKGKERPTILQVPLVFQHSS